MFSNRNQSIPDAFLTKMDVDDNVDKMRSLRVVSMERGKEVLRYQASVREGCKKFISRALSGKD